MYWCDRYLGPADSTPKAPTKCLGYLPYLILLETLCKFPASTEEERSLRVRVQEVGVLQLVLQCLSVASHHSPRVEGEGEATAHNMSLQDRYVINYMYWRERCMIT